MWLSTASIDWALLSVINSTHCEWLFTLVYAAVQCTSYTAHKDTYFTECCFTNLIFSSTLILSRHCTSHSCCLSFTNAHRVLVNLPVELVDIFITCKRACMVMHSVVSVCLCVSVCLLCLGSNFWKAWPRKFRSCSYAKVMVKVIKYTHYQTESQHLLAVTMQTSLEFNCQQLNSWSQWILVKQINSVYKLNSQSKGIAKIMDILLHWYIQYSLFINKYIQNRPATLYYSW